MKTPIYYTEKEIKEVANYIYGGEDDESGFICHEWNSEYVHSDVIVSSSDTERRFTTMGMGARNMNSPNGLPKNIELIMYSTPNNTSNADAVICQQLIRLTKMPFEENGWLGMFHTIDAAEGFKNEFGFDGFFLLPIDDKIELGSGKLVEFLHVLPVYQNEMEWLWEHGKDINNIYDFIDINEDYYIDNDLPLGAANVKRPALVPNGQ